MNVHFQPIVDLDTDAVVRAEALCRLNVDVDGLEGTAEYIARAEQQGFIRELTASVFDLAFRDLEHLPHDLAPAISINVSQANLEEPDFFDRIEAILSRYGIKASCLTVELPEGIELLNAGPAFNTLRRLTDAGVRLSVDGFGPALSMFTYIELARLNVREVKVDARLLGTMGASRRAVLASILELCRSCHVDAVIKNVETREQLEMARELGCNCAQGYLIAVPMESSELRTWLSGHAVVPAERRASTPSEAAPPVSQRWPIFEKLRTLLSHEGDGEADLATRQAS